MRTSLTALALVASLSPALAQEDGAPMSAIDWLSDSLAEPVALTPAEPPVDGANVTEITVAPIDAESRVVPDAVGLFAPGVSGLPADLWGPADADTLARLISEEQRDMLPAMNALLVELMLAELDPPAGAPGEGETVFLARVDKLLELGALDQAHALLQRAGSGSANIVRRWFDVSLLIGQEDEVCTALEATPDLTPTYPARIFCLARAGDWDGAVILLGNARALNLITEDEDMLLARFLDPDLFEGEEPLVAPRRMTPLTFRLFEAIGEPIPTATLPLAFAQADLRSNIGWKAQIEAGERLARTGAVSDNQLLGLYTQQRPAASGGVWERVDAVQDLETALAENDEKALETLLPRLWRELSASETEVHVAHVHGAAVAALDLDGDAGAIAFRMGLLTKEYEAVAQAAKPKTREEKFLVAVAQGNLGGVEAPNEEARAIADGFLTRQIPSRYKTLVDTGRLGEAILRAQSDFTAGSRGDLDELADALALFRLVGLEGSARRAALELLILERRG